MRAALDSERIDALRALEVAPTPLVSLSGGRVVAKLECLQPSGSTKDRIARRILLEAVADGRLHRSSRVVEASSGSTSISLAMACAVLGVAFHAVMPEGVSGERLLMIRRFGATYELTPTAAGVPGSIQRTLELAASDPTVFLSDQFNNPANAAAQRAGTGAELVTQVDRDGGRLDGFVAAVGTGGTLMGVGAAVHERWPGAVVARVRVADEPADAEQGALPCGIPGVVDCLSGLLDPQQLELADELPVARAEALAVTRELCAQGLPVGPSSGLNVAGARQLAERLGPSAVVATVLCDRMERYFSTDLFDDLRDP